MAHIDFEDYDKTLYILEEYIRRMMESKGQILNDINVIRFSEDGDIELESLRKKIYHINKIDEYIDKIGLIRNKLYEERMQMEELICNSSIMDKICLDDEKD